MEIIVPTESDWRDLQTIQRCVRRGDLKSAVWRIDACFFWEGRRLPEAVALLALLRDNGAQISPEQGGTANLWREAIRGLSARAVHEEPEALYALGWCALLGKGVKADRKAAFKRWRRAARVGHSRAMHLAGTFLQLGIGGAKVDTKEAVEWLTSAARVSLRASQRRLAALLAKEARDWKEARLARYWGLRARGPHGYAEEHEHCRQLIDSAQRPGAHPRARRLLRWLASRYAPSSGKANGMLVELFDLGVAAPLDIQEAYAWYSEAACTSGTAPALRRRLREEVCRFAGKAVPPNSKHRPVLDLIATNWEGGHPDAPRVARKLLLLGAEDGWTPAEWAVRAVARKLGALSDVAFDYPIELEGNVWRNRMIGGPVSKWDWGIFSAIVEGLDSPLLELRRGMDAVVEMGFPATALRDGRPLEAVGGDFLAFIIDRFQAGDRQYRVSAQLLTWELYAEGKRGDRWPREEDEG